jgi:hypothetical protein
MESSRGCGKFFGLPVLQQFLEENSLKCLIRGHQCVYQGVKVLKNAVITVFSTSFYNDEENKGGFLIIDENGEYRDVILAPYRPVKRGSAQFARVNAVRDTGAMAAIQRLKAAHELACASYGTVPFVKPVKMRLSLVLVPFIVKSAPT